MLKDISTSAFEKGKLNKLIISVNEFSSGELLILRTSIQNCSILPIFFHYIHTFIIAHYNSSVRITDLGSHTTYVVCGNFIQKRRDIN